VIYEISPARPHFVDREAERERALRAVDEWQEPFRPLCIALSGLAGVGKTELAHQFIRDVLPRFPDGVLHVDLDDSRVRGAADLMDALGSLTRGLEVAPEWSGHSLADRHKWYRTRTRGSRLAVIIENARYASEVEPLLPGSGLSMVIVTSRAPLAGLEAGAAVEIPVLPLGDQHALALLLSVAGDERLDRDPDMARELARLCGGLPLAIRVAACFVRGHPRPALPVLLDAISSTFHEEGLPAVESIWDAAYEALGPGAARLYRLLAYAPGTTFTVHSAAAILGCGVDAAVEALEELDAAALVVNVGDDFAGQRMVLPAPLRAHARRRVQRHGDQEEVAGAQRRIVSWYLRQAQLADARTAGSRLVVAPRVPALPGIEDAPVDDAFEWVDAERHALYGCVAIAAARRFDAEAWALCEPLFTHYLDHPHYGEAIDAFRAGVEAAQRAGHVPAIVRMRCLLAFPYWDQGKFGEAAREVGQALAAAQSLGSSDDDRKLKASATEFRGRLRGAEGNWEDAKADFADALDVHEAIGNDYGVMLLSYRLGQALARLDEPARAVGLLERAYRMAARLGRERMIARTGSALADVLRGLGQPGQARELYLASLESARRRHSDFDEARVLDALAALADETGDARAAREYREEADAIRVRNGGGSP
jgi:tetratricopeptide (TPR) repeat protein